MSLTVDGVWKAGVWATTAWADGVWREGAPPEPPAEDIPQGGHYWPDVKRDDWRERNQKQRRELLERIINGVEDAPAEIREEVADIVRPYRQGARLTRASLDRLADNLRAVERLLAAYQEYIDDEDAAAILLMS